MPYWEPIGSDTYNCKGNEPLPKNYISKVNIPDYMPKHGGAMSGEMDFVYSRGMPKVEDWIVEPPVAVDVDEDAIDMSEVEEMI